MGGRMQEALVALERVTARVEALDGRLKSQLNENRSLRREVRGVVQDLDALIARSAGA